MKVVHVSKDSENWKSKMGKKIFLPHLYMGGALLLGVCGNYGLAIMSTFHKHKVAITLRHLPK